MPNFAGVTAKGHASDQSIQTGRDTIAVPDEPTRKLSDHPFFVPSMGVDAVGNPVSPAPTSFKGMCSRSIAEDWVDRVHILPRRIDFGNILGTVIDNLELFSSFRDQDVSFTAFTNNVGVGMSITDLPGLPVTVTPFSGLFLTLETTTLGDPQFNTTLDFVFDVGTLMMPVTGTRVIMFPYEPDAPMIETLKFLTDIYVHKDGSEQRVALRKNPRSSFNMEYSRLEGTERSRIDMLMFDWQSRVFGLPLWHESMQLTQSTLVNDTVINVDTTTFKDLRVGSILMLLQSDEVTFEALEISSFTANTITLTSGVQFAHPAGATLVMPVRTAITKGDFRGQREPTGLGRFQIVFDVIDNDSDLADTSAFNTFNTKVLLDDKNFIDDVMSETYKKRIIRFDNETGIITNGSPWDVNQRFSTKTFKTNNRQELWEVRQLLHALRGRQVSFWVPTFSKEFIPTEGLTSGNQLLTIENVGYSIFVQNRPPKEKIRVTLTNGIELLRDITSSAEIDRFTEQLTVDSGWPSTEPLSNIKSIDIFEPVRIDSDNIKIEHENALGQATIRFPIKVVFE